jgi:pyruvate dehydrogenase E2 component (dihydrolipoamide acetyltransferase)
MATEVMMPQVGQDIKTGVIIEWFKKENDPIQKGETIATVESDKATFEVEAYESGVLLKILHDAGAEVPVLTPIAYIGRPGEEIAAEKPAVETTSPPALEQKAPSETVSVPRHSGPAASPSARRLAKEKGIDLETVTGTGPGGRITKEDVLNAAEK